MNLLDLVLSRLDDLISMKQTHMEKCETMEEFKKAQGHIAGLREAGREFKERWDKAQRDEEEKT